MEAKSPMMYRPRGQPAESLRITEPMVYMLDWLWGTETWQYQLWGLEKIGIEV